MKYIPYLLAFSLFLLVSCEKDLLVKEAPDLEISAAETTVKVGEELVFSIEGEADLISFYSGQLFNDYDYKDGHVAKLNGDGASLSFTSSVQSGAQADQLAVMASTDFDGNYTYDGVKAATWIDITDRFKLATTNGFTPSTDQDLSDLLQADKPIYIAFKYLTLPQEVNGLARQWMVQDFRLTSTAPYNGIFPTLTDQVYSAFTIVDQDGVNTPSRSFVTSTRLTLLGNIYKDPLDPIYDPTNPIYDPANPIYDPQSELYEESATLPVFVAYEPGSPYNDPTRETWAVSKPIITGEVDLGPDLSIPVQGIRNPIVKEFRYTYSKPGTYKAHFVGINSTIDRKKSVVKEVTITVEP